MLLKSDSSANQNCPLICSITQFQLDETLASLRMEKALVCGELSEEEGMLQLERAQLSDISDMTRNRDEDLIHELQKTIQERSLRIDSLKVRSKLGHFRVNLKIRFDIFLFASGLNFVSESTSWFGCRNT